MGLKQCNRAFFRIAGAKLVKENWAKQDEFDVLYKFLQKKDVLISKQFVKTSRELHDS